MAPIYGDKITENAITPASLNSNCPGAGRSTMPSRLSALLSILASFLKSSLSPYSLEQNDERKANKPLEVAFQEIARRVETTPEMLRGKDRRWDISDKARRFRGVKGAGIRLRGKRSGEVPATRSGQYQYDALAVVGAADGEQLIDCNDCYV